MLGGEADPMSGGEGGEEISMSSGEEKTMSFSVLRTH